MTAPAKQSSTKPRLLLASDRSDQSSELADILQSVGEVETNPTSYIPAAPAGHFSGIVVDINLRSPESVQRVRNKLRAEAYRSVPRLFVLADALHHGSMQAWALGATDTISRPFDAEGILQRIRAAFPDTIGFDATASGKALNRRIAAAQAVMVKIFEKLPAGTPRSSATSWKPKTGSSRPSSKPRCGNGWRPSAAIRPTAIATASLSPDSRLRSHSISGCARTTSAGWRGRPSCTMSARRSSPWRSWTSPENSPTRKRCLLYTSDAADE